MKLRTAAVDDAQSHVPALDGLRGLAILMVMCHHFFWSNTESPSFAARALANIAHAGWAGVDLFFVLSGFLITRILYSTVHEPGYFRNFYARRVLRIFPIYYLILVVLALLTLPLHFDWHGTLPWYLVYVANLRASGPIPLPPVPTPYWQINHFWSLQVEEQFYLVWPFLVFKLKAPRRIVMTAIVLSIAAFALRFVLALHASQWNNPYWCYAFTPCRIDSLLYGAMLAILWFSRYRAQVARWSPAVLAVCVAALSAIAWQHHGLRQNGDFLMSTAGFSLLALAAAALIAVVMSVSAADAVFRIKPLRWLGKYSYGLYVFHFSLFAFFVGPLRQYFSLHTHSRLVVVGAPGIIIGAASVALAYVSYNAYEKYFLKLKRYFSYDRRVVFQQPGI